MFNVDRSSTPLPFHWPDRHLDDWRAAEQLVTERWEAFLDAEPAARKWAYVTYLAALDAEEAAARMIWTASQRAA